MTESKKGCPMNSKLISIVAVSLAVIAAAVAMTVVSMNRAEEAQDELEEKMLDEKGQEELKKLAAQIREQKLNAAEKELKAAEAAAENERGKLDAAKKSEDTAVKTPVAPVAVDKKAEVLGLIDQLSEETKAKQAE